ncbi:MAG TPA: porin family protein, partial [Candidatus Polarisedimenticolia bacterium]|nr:porin family protein [Candidatus Polarisedimenticolia bacterium]
RLLPAALVLAIVLFAGMPAAHAGIYFGASVGDTSVSQEDSGFSFDSSDTSYKAFVGWQFLKFFGIEASYLDLGTQEDTPTPGTDVSVDVTAWDAFVVGNLPLGKHFELFAKAGIVVWDTSTSISGITGDSSDDGNDPAYGAGLKFIFGHFFAVRAEYERFDIEDTDKVDMASVGAEFRF